jgi:hypothetical protein
MKPSRCSLPRRFHHYSCDDACNHVLLAKNSKRRKIGEGCFLAAKGKEKEGHFWCKEGRRLI